MATFAELVLEAVKNNSFRIGMITNIDHDNKIIHVNLNKPCINIDDVIDNRLHQRRKEKELIINKLLNSGYKIQYDR